VTATINPELAAAVEEFTNPYCRANQLRDPNHGGPHAFCPYSQEQWDFTESSATEVFFGGAAGPGKSVLLVNEGLRQVDKEGYTAVLFRRTFDELAQIIEMSHATFPALGGVFTGGPPSWRFYGRDQSASPNVMRGKRPISQYDFKYCARDQDKYRYQGKAYSYIAWDELTQYPNMSVYDYLFSRCRPFKQDTGIFSYVRSASNPGGPGHPVRQGEVLTPRGWQDIWSLWIGDPIMTITDKGEIVETHIEQRHVQENVRKLVQVNARGLFMECSPDHSVAKVGGTKQNRDTNHSLIPFNELPGQAVILRSGWWDGERVGRFDVPYCPTRKRKVKQPKSLCGMDYAALVGWMLAEGCTIDRDKAFLIAQSKPHGRRILRRLLACCGFKVSWSDTQATVYAADWWAHFKRLGKSREKHIPYRLKQAVPMELHALLMALMEGDGHWTRRGLSGEYYTISKQLADDVCEVAFKLGYVVHLSSRQRKNRRGLSYCVSFKKVKSGGTELLTGQHKYNVKTETKRRSDIQTVPNSDQTICLGVPETHAMIIRQQGSVWVSGNSWVKERFIEGRVPGQQYVEIAEDPVSGKQLKYTRQYIPATLDSNDILMNNSNYELMLLIESDPEIRKALRHGDWDIIAGIMFSELRENIHKVEARPPLSWTSKEVAVDYGYGNFTHALWIETTTGVEDRPRSTVYRELVIKGIPPPLIAQMITEMTPPAEKISKMTWDTNAFATHDGGPDPIEQMMSRFRADGKEHDRKWPIVGAVKGAGSRQRGWKLLHTYFFAKRAGGPLATVMDNCPVLWRQLTSLIRGIEPHDVEDLEPHQVDHGADAFRYWAQGRPHLADMTPDELILTDPDFNYQDEPRTHKARQIERARQEKKAGFPAVRVGQGPKKKPKRNRPF